MERARHILPNWHIASQLARQRLPVLVEALQQQYKFTPYLGCELEWYVDAPEREELIAAAHKALEKAAALEGLHITAIKPESGNGQYEVGFAASTNPVGLAQAIHDFRALVQQHYAPHGLHALWDAKPYSEDYGSALQVHIHLVDAAGARVYVKREKQMSASLEASLGGLLDITPEAMRVAAPQAKSFARFVPKYDAPVTICWGGNNRSTTLRLPMKSGPHCHIEYRLAGADADPASMLGVLLAGVLHGLENRPHPGEQIHGVASDGQYGLPTLPATAAEAERLFSESRVLRRWMGEEWFEAVRNG